jgi:hypothetical protein
MNAAAIPDGVKQDVERRVSSSGGAFLAALVERLGGSASAAAVYGQPVERDGLTLIPVARLAWGMGGGSGSGNAADGAGSGEGGGGGASASPVGFIEIRDGHAEFRPIRMRPPVWTFAPVVMASGVAALLALHGLRRLLRG